MSDNPFSEPEEDRTIIRPKPGGRRGAVSDKPPAAVTPPEPPARPQPPAPLTPPAPPAPPTPPAPPAGRAEPALETMSATATVNIPPLPVYAVGTDKLATLSEPLILLLARLWNAAAKPFSGDLYAMTGRALRRFEKDARDAGVPIEQLRPAHFALCAALDDVVLNTPWGGAAGWERRTLAETFHQEKQGGERFFTLLNELSRNPSANLPVIELMYLCLSLGVMGPYRRMPDGVARFEQLRQEVFALIRRERPDEGSELSRNWRGVDAPFVPGQAGFPAWVTISGAVTLVAGMFLWVMIGLNTASDGVMARMLAAPPATMPAISRAPLIRPPPPPPEPPEPTSADRLRLALKPEIDKQLLEVLGNGPAAVVRINTQRMFPSASATLQSQSVPLIEKVSAAVKAELAVPNAAPATVQINAYTDNQPVRTVKFPSNFKLSASRAEAVRDVMQKTVGKTPPITVEGRADGDPIDSNATAEGRAQNQRVEIILRRRG